MARIAVIGGGGAIGGTLAAWLAQSPEHELTICVRSPVGTLNVEHKQGMIHAAPRVLTDPAQAEPVDWVLAATKTYDSAAAAAWLPGLVGPETRVAVIQNGVEQRERFRGHVPDDRVVPAIIDLPAERRGPGNILQRRYGTIHVPEGPDGEAFVALFAHTPIKAQTTDDFITAAWRKLAINCSGAVSALTLRPAEVANDPEIAEVMRGLVRECIAVGRAEGADLPDELADKVVGWTLQADPQSVNSLQADRMAGRRMEIDARNRVIVRLGAKHGIAAPLNAMAAAVIEASAPL